MDHTDSPQQASTTQTACVLRQVALALVSALGGVVTYKVFKKK